MFFPREKCNSQSLGKKYVFCTAGASRGPFGTKKKLQTMTSPGESEFRGLNAWNPQNIWKCRVWTPKMHPQKSSRTYIFKNMFVPRENEIAKVREKNTFFARPGPIGVRLGRKKNYRRWLRLENRNFEVSMLEILKTYENVEFGLRKCRPKNLPEHEFSKIRSSHVKMK